MKNSANLTPEQSFIQDLRTYCDGLKCILTFLQAKRDVLNKYTLTKPINALVRLTENTFWNNYLTEAVYTGAPFPIKTHAYRNLKDIDPDGDRHWLGRSIEFEPDDPSFAVHRINRADCNVGKPSWSGEFVKNATVDGDPNTNYMFCDTRDEHAIKDSQQVVRIFTNYVKAVLHLTEIRLHDKLDRLHRRQHRENVVSESYAKINQGPNSWDRILKHTSQRVRNALTKEHGDY